MAAAFLTRSQTKDVSARSLVQDSGAPAWLSTAGARFADARSMTLLNVHRTRSVTTRRMPGPQAALPYVCHQISGEVQPKSAGTARFSPNVRKLGPQAAGTVRFPPNQRKGSANARTPRSDAGAARSSKPCAPSGSGNMRGVRSGPDALASSRLGKSQSGWRPEPRICRHPGPVAEQTCCGAVPSYSYFPSGAG